MEPTSLATDILAAAMDAVIIMDAVGRVLYWNPAAERLFGIAADQVIGRDLADLLIPPDQRERHRAGLARAAAGRPGAILGRRFEVAGLAPDGTSVPVELTVTRVERLGRTLFVGYLRDITERRRAIAELRDSRRRLVTVSDETRPATRSRRRSPRSASWPAGCIRTSCPGAAFPERCPISPAGPASWWTSAISKRAGCRPTSRWPPTTCWPSR